MMAYLRIALSAVLAILLATIALANREFVSVQLFPEAIGNLIGFNFGFGLPLFILLGLAIGLGLMLGFIWEWLREHSYRAEAARLRRRVARDGKRSGEVPESRPVGCAEMTKCWPFVEAKYTLMTPAARVKICGLTSLRDLEAAATAGANYAGFVFFCEIAAPPVG